MISNKKAILQFTILYCEISVLCMGQAKLICYRYTRIFFSQHTDIFASFLKDFFCDWSFLHSSGNMRITLFSQQVYNTGWSNLHSPSLVSPVTCFASTWAMRLQERLAYNKELAPDKFSENPCSPTVWPAPDCLSPVGASPPPSPWQRAFHHGRPRLPSSRPPMNRPVESLRNWS